MNNTPKIFVEGMFFRPRTEKQPDFIRGSIFLNVGSMKQFFIANQEHISEKGYLNVVLKKSQKGTYYFELDTWKPNSTSNSTPKQASTAPTITVDESNRLKQARDAHNAKTLTAEEEYNSIDASSIPF